MTQLDDILRLYSAPETSGTTLPNPQLEGKIRCGNDRAPGRQDHFGGEPIDVLGDQRETCKDTMGLTCVFNVSEGSEGIVCCNTGEWNCRDLQLFI